MADPNDTTVAQFFFRSPPQQLDGGRARLSPNSLEEVHVHKRQSTPSTEKKEPDFNQNTVAQPIMRSPPQRRDRSVSRESPSSDTHASPQTEASVSDFNGNSAQLSFRGSSRLRYLSHRRHTPESRSSERSGDREPDFDDTTVAQPFIRSPRRLKSRSRERRLPMSQEEVYVGKRRTLRNAHTSSPRPDAGYARLTRSPHRLDNSRSLPRRPITFDHEGQDESSDSDGEYKERRIVRRHRADRRDNEIIPYSPNPFHEAGVQGARGYEHDSDSDVHLSCEEWQREEQKLRRKRYLYMGLACVTTIAAGNTIYQNTKAHHARHDAVRRGQLSAAEARKQRRRAIMFDAVSVGVAAVGINNARLGWKRVETMGKQGRGAQDSSSDLAQTLSSVGMERF